MAEPRGRPGREPQAALGLRRRTLLASLHLEQALLVLFGLVVGTAAGVGAAVLALPSIPAFVDVPTAPPLRYDVHLGPVLLSVLAGSGIWHGPSRSRTSQPQLADTTPRGPQLDDRSWRPQNDGR